MIKEIKKIKETLKSEMYLLNIELKIEKRKHLNL